MRQSSDMSEIGENGTVTLQHFDCSEGYFCTITLSHIIEEMFQLDHKNRSSKRQQTNTSLQLKEVQ